MQTIKRCFLMLAVGVGVVQTDAAMSQTTYPDRAIKMIVAWPAGGGTDNVARLVAKFLSERLKQPIVVENKSGASGVIGTEYAAKAVPDGYTIQYTVADSHSINPHVFKNVSFDALKDFIPVAVVGSMPNVLVANNSVQASNMAEFLKLARAEPDRFTYASWGIASGAHIRTEAFNKEAKIKLRHIPYQGSGPAFAAIVGQQVDVMMVPLGLAYATAKAGKVKILGVDTLQRVVEAPEIPTFTEMGIPVSLAFWQGILVPAKTPVDVVIRLNKEMNEILADSKVRQALLGVGVTVRSNDLQSLAQLKTYMADEYQRWGSVIRNAQITEK
jgi:tripartite-type tricarboxylate transporter receptor subunit TctC